MRAVFLIPVILLACADEVAEDDHVQEAMQTVEETAVDTVRQDTTSVEPQPPVVIGDLEQSLIDAGLVNIQALDPTILVDLKYTTVDNFIGVDVYGDLTNAYLQPDVAEKLAKAQGYLRERDSTLSLLVYDAVRPRRVQQIMWDTLDMPMDRKVKFVSNPRFGSLHNFGAAVDITIADAQGIPINMGAGFDEPDIIAWPVKEQQMLEEGRLEDYHIKNRQLLRSVMGRAGFFNIQTEWWHFNSCYRETAYELYTIVE